VLLCGCCIQRLAVCHPAGGECRLFSFEKDLFGLISIEVNAEPEISSVVLAVSIEQDAELEMFNNFLLPEIFWAVFQYGWI